jgi:prolyl oligopeptidase PreP (S9A serine peptidase family)
MGERALVWVAERNIASSDELAESEEFKEISSRLLSIFDSDERIPGVVKMGEYYYNFWRDADSAYVCTDFFTNELFYLRDGKQIKIETPDSANGERNLDLLFEPTERTSLARISETRNHILLNVLDSLEGIAMNKELQ